MDQKQKQKLKKFIKELNSIKGRHTELVSVYIPAGYDINKIIQHLQQEQGTASNIKDKTTRTHVIDSLEKMIRHLRLYKKTPENGLAAFSGNASDVDSKVDLKVWSIEPPEPITTRMYRCDQSFVLNLLEDMMEVKEVYGLIVLDRREANIGLLKGTYLKELASFTSDVPGKTTKGGQCCSLGSLVQTSGGDIKKIKDLHNPYIVKSLDNKNFKLNDSPILDKWKVKKNKVYKITTKHPRLELSTSEDHLFLYYDGDIKEKPAKELKIGDCLLTPEKIEVNGKLQKLKTKKYYNSYSINQTGRKLLKKLRIKKEDYQKKLAKKLELTQTAISFIELGKRNISYGILKKLCIYLNLDTNEFIEKYSLPAQKIKLPNLLDETLAQIVGYLLGDGNIENTRLNFSERDEETVLYYKKLICNYFNAKGRYRHRDKKNYYELRIQGKPISKFIKKEFPEIKNARDSIIPSKILRSPNKILASFLKGLYDAEGFISGQKVTIALNNEILIRQIQIALLRFGIINSFLEYDNKRNPHTDNHKFIVDITERESAVLFRDYIGFSFSDKKNKLNHLIKNVGEKSSVRQILYNGSKIRGILKQFNLNTSTRHFLGASNFFVNRDVMSKKRFEKIILSKIRDVNAKDYLTKIRDISVLPTKIQKIRIINKKTPMVDISVKNQNFIANGILVHNSQQRYARIREIAAKEFFKKVGDAANKLFLEMKDLKGIIIGGPIPTKESFFDGDFLNNEVKKKVIGMRDLAYTGEFGLNELIDKSKDLLKEQAVIKERKILEKFFTLLAKEPNKVTYGQNKTRKALEMGAVDILLLSESLDDKEIEEFGKIAERYNTDVEIISTDTEGGIQLRELGEVAAILRFPIS